MDDDAKKLAQGLISSGEESYETTFTLKNSDEVIIVVAVRTSKKGGEVMRKFSESIVTKAVSGPIGKQCPACGGTGKISY